MLIRVFLHAEFIICNENSSKSYDFREKCKKKKKKKNRKMISFGNFCYFLRFSLKLLSRISEKVIKCFLDGKEDK